MENTVSLLSDKKIIVASYTHFIDGKETTIGGPALALREYLRDKVNLLMFIRQPMPLSDTLTATAMIVRRGQAVTIRRLPVINWPFGREKAISALYVVLKLRDIFSDLYFVLSSGVHFDIFIGVEAVNALVGVFLRGIGCVEKVVYYNLDYGEHRLPNPILNFIFHFLDRKAASHSDYTWGLSGEMAKARKRMGLDDARASFHLVVPVGIHFSRIRRLPTRVIDRQRIVYLGVLSEHQGVQLILEALPDIVKDIPGVKLTVIGTGPLEAKLKSMVKENKLEGHVDFTGLIPDKEAEDILCSSALGLAPYLDDPRSNKKTTEPTKPKTYMSCGLPVIITRVPPNAGEIEKNGAGILIDYEKNDLIDAVKLLLTNDQVYNEYRSRAIEYASRFDWQNIFDNAFRPLLWQENLK
ncbi:MAG: glycosyltransferase [Candidatus Omnitrophica bacterium]|nr:glycosyltransferase [Candidatus Omnitrophota bacterium]